MDKGKQPHENAARYFYSAAVGYGHDLVLTWSKKPPTVEEIFDAEDRVDQVAAARVQVGVEVVQRVIPAPVLAVLPPVVKTHMLTSVLNALAALN